ncbi:MAG: protein-methionine-sulfoxide reductase heme-binding subunit MsrQ, partial [Escherichia coli]|nr:protein-methionine-sulfoxide reductase heme-binding subunit MsrQ [Escherichia coli]
MRLTAKQVTWLKVCLHLAGLLPFLWLAWAINHGGLGADPVKDIQHFTGRTALKFLLATLLITPLARYAKQPLLIRTRRLLGLWCFAWATLHLTSYTLLELGINNLA